MVFGHRKSFGVHRVVIGSPEGVPDTPDNCMGLMGQGGGADQPTRGLVRPSPWPTSPRGRKGEVWPLLPLPPQERKERGAPPPSFLPHSK